MTAKRFKQLTKNGFNHAFIDMKNPDISYCCDNEYDCTNIVELLNALSDENEQLGNELNTYKETNKLLKQTIDRILTDNIHFKTKLNELMKKEYNKNE